MKRKITFLSLMLLLGFINRSNGQTCPDNVDFEWGTTANWSFFNGTCCPIVTPTSTPPLVNRHELTTGAALDAYGGFPIVAPGGGAYSMKLGNTSVGAQAEKARYFVRVPTGSGAYALVYRYAVVLQNPGHSIPEQPRFEVSAKDSATGFDIPCAAYSYVATSGLPGFFVSPISSQVLCKGWSTATINLSGLGGTTVMIDFASGDCSQGGHFGYGYFDMNCGLFQVAGINCDDTATTLTLSAPFGYEFYRWYDSATFTTLYGSTSTITIPIPPGPVTLAVILTPYVGYGCPDTLFTRISPNHLALNPTPDTLICNGAGLTITSGATDVALPLSYSWAPATGLSCTTCANPFASPTSITTYTVTVTNGNGCVKDTTITVSIGLVTSTVTKVDDTCAGYNNGSATAIVTAGIPPFTYAWSTTPVQTTPTATGLYGNGPTGSITYTVTITDASGCAFIDTVSIKDGPRTVLSVVNAVNPDSCDIANGSITLDSLIADSTFTIHYLFNGVYQTQTVTANTSWQVTLTGLANGTYSNIGVITNHCPYNIVGPVVLNDPPLPSVPAMSSNSPVCLGSPMNLTALSTPGVSYTWSGPGGFTSVFQNPVVTPATYADSGKYVVVVMINNCYSRDSIRTKVIPLPFPVGASNSPVCTGDTLFIMGSSSNGASSYTWNGPDGFYSYSQNPFIDDVKMPAAGTYTVTVNLNGCVSTATTAIVINLTPDPPTVADTQYCQYDVAAPLTAGGTGLLWYSSATGGVGSPTAPIPSTQDEGTKTYYVSQVSAPGCEGGRSPIKVYVDYLATPILVSSDSVICKGTDIQFNAKDAGGNITGLTWVFGDGDSSKGQNPILHSYDQAGSWEVTATTTYKVCPEKTIRKSIVIFPSPSVYLGPDTSICPGGVAIMLHDYSNAGNSEASWRWNTGSGGSSLKVTAPGSYYVKVSINGCYATDTLVVYNDCYMNLPNVFTPNGDGLNDYFFPRQLLTKGLTSFGMEIFNRWGQLVFSTNTLDGSGWDGKFNNVAQPVGVYIYVIDATFKDGQKETHKGNVTLLR